MNKRILVVSQVIPQWYVDVLTNAFNPEDELVFITGSSINGQRVDSPKHDPKSFKSRLICWYRHAKFLKKWARENAFQKFHLIFAVSNPPINSFLGLKLKKVFRAPFVYMNWDLYPQCIDYNIKNPVVHFICKLWHKKNSQCYPRIDRMLTIGEVMADSINADIKQKIPVTVIPIAVNTGRMKPIEPQENSFRKQYGLEDKLVVLFSGKMGYGHNIELILEAAERLKENDNIRFVFIGEGPKFKTVDEFIKTHDSKNILLLTLQPEEVFPLSMACGDIGIVSQEVSMAHLFMPSKTYSMMACGMAIIGISGTGDDLYRLIGESQIGYSVTDGDAGTLSDIIEELEGNPEQLKKFKENARECAVNLFDSDAVTSAYRKLFSEII